MLTRTCLFFMTDYSNVSIQTFTDDELVQLLNKPKFFREQRLVLKCIKDKYNSKPEYMLFFMKHAHEIEWFRLSSRQSRQIIRFVHDSINNNIPYCLKHICYASYIMKLQYLNLCYLCA